MTHNHSGYLFDSDIVIAILDNDHATVNLRKTTNILFDDYRM
ncbi:hypothetical protein [Paenibacillus nasutitermitis]|uniref:Uncharacterized protein n=1 Tax=Paenibacillus nasutitermitis TaxID=1652958 RepID=A0A917E2W3_9BACL|nr:hypothetical protein [Paenibacillus nasutitermitis]GGD94859.1 hypothetical protein GCM10010911_61920 [Paenibacillus nasutitermitis]